MRLGGRNVQRPTLNREPRTETEAAEAWTPTGNGLSPEDSTTLLTSCVFGSVWLLVSENLLSYLLTIHVPRTRTSILVRRKHSRASRGWQTTGSFSLKLVLSTIGTPVI